ncbi:YCF48-related protein [Bacteroidota bacterium]
MKNVKRLFLLFFVFVFVIGLSQVLTNCYGPSENDPIESGNGTVEGKVLDINGYGISGASIECAGKIAYTNATGEFTLKNLPAGNRKLVNFSKDNYASTQKIVCIKDMQKSYIEASLSQVGKTQTVNSGTNSSVSANGALVELQANGLIDSDGNSWSGNATVKLTYFDPDHERFNDAFPGEFLGISTNGDEVPIESYGFIDVEIFGGSEKLQLAEGKPATVTMPIPAKLLANAPTSIPLWHYDTDKGQWIEFGTANKVGNNYVGEVTHFSKINCDMKYDELSEVKGRVHDQEGNPLPNAWVKLSGVDFAGGGSGYSDENGDFHFIRVKANSEIKLLAYFLGFYSEPLIVTTAPNGEIKENCDIEIIIDPNLVSGWDELANPPQGNLTDMQFLDENTGWIVANGIYRTDDGGASWIKQLDGGSGKDSLLISSIFMIDENNGWAAGTTLYFTTNGGIVWEEKDLGETYPYFRDVFFVDANYGWVAGNKSYRTTDGGSTWEKIWDGQILKVFFVDQSTGYASGYYNALKTFDGGVTWEEIELPFDSLTNSYGSVSFYFTDANNGWITNSGHREKENNIYHTNDGGNSWTEQEHNAIGSLNDVFFINSLEGWIVGSAGTILHTIDGGNLWSFQFNKTNGDFKKVCFVTNLIGWAGGGNYQSSILLYTDTGGEPE